MSEIVTAQSVQQLVFVLVIAGLVVVMGLVVVDRLVAARFGIGAFATGDIAFSASRFANATGRNSRYLLTGGGGAASDYHDIDQALGSPELAYSLALELAKEVGKIEKRSQRKVDRLVFLEQRAGPVGLLTSKDLIGVVAGIPTTVMRLQRDIESSATLLKGALLSRDSTIVFVTDVTTDGVHLEDAIRRLRDVCGATVVGIVSTIDRARGADRLFENAGIRFTSLMTFPISDPERSS